MGLDRPELEALWTEMIDLPDDDLSLLVPLPELLTPAIQRVCDAISDEDPEEAEIALAPVLTRHDTPVVRAGLARSVIGLRERDHIRPKLAAVVLIDLAIDSSTFLKTSLITSVAMLAGATSTPAGLVLATR